MFVPCFVFVGCPVRVFYPCLRSCPARSSSAALGGAMGRSRRGWLRALPDAVDAPADCISEEQEVPAPPRREARLVLLKPPEIDLSQCAPAAAESSVPSEHSSNNASSVSTATATSRARPSLFVRCCRSALCVLGTVLLALLAFATTAERATRAGANPLSTTAPTSTPLPSAQPPGPQPCSDTGGNCASKASHCE